MIRPRIKEELNRSKYNTRTTTVYHPFGTTADSIYTGLKCYLIFHGLIIPKKRDLTFNLLDHGLADDLEIRVPEDLSVETLVV